MIEDVEECLLGLGLTDQALDIIDDEDIHLLIEVDEAPTLRPTHQAVTDELGLKLRAGDVADAFGGVNLHSTLSDRLAEVGLPYTAGAIDEDEVQWSLPRACCRSLSDT